VPTQKEVIRQLDAMSTKENKTLIDEVKHLLGQDSRSSRQICVIGSASGAGATTVACNLALELAKHSKTALIDLDLEFGGIECVFDIDANHTISDVCNISKDEEIDKSLLNSALCEQNGVFILGRPNHILEANSVSPDGVSKILQVVSDMFDFVTVDMSRVNGDIGVEAMKLADQILIVVQPNVLCLRNAVRIQNMAIELGIDLDKFGIILNRFESKNNLTGKIESILKMPIACRVPNDYTAVSLSLDVGINTKSENPVRAAIKELANDIRGIPRKSPKGVVSRLRLKLRGKA